MEAHYSHKKVCVGPLPNTRITEWSFKMFSYPPHKSTFIKDQVYSTNVMLYSIFQKDGNSRLKQIDSLRF